MNKSLLRWLGTGIAAALIVLVWAQPSVAWAAEHGADASVTTHGFHNSKAVAFLFWFFTACTLGGAIFVITRRNMVTAVMGMVGTFFAIAGIFLMLYASFLAVMQVLVYAGAIMVLFVFVIMILNRPESEPWALHGLLGKGLAAVGLLYLFGRLASILWQVKETHALEVAGEKLHAIVTLDPLNPAVRSGAQEALTRTYEFGSVEGVGYTLFSKYLFPFEAVSIVLLVAVVGAIAIARPVDKEAADQTFGAVMNSAFYDLTVSHFLILAAALFMIGVAGVLIRRNALIVMMSIELMLNAANITILAFSRGFAGSGKTLADPGGPGFQGQAFALIVIAIAAAEAAVGLAIVVTVFRSRRHSDIDRLTLLKN